MKPLFATEANLDALAAGAGEVHLVFIPDWQRPRFLLWGNAAAEHEFAVLGEPAVASLLDADLQIREVPGYALPVLDATRALAGLNASQLPRESPSVAVWSLAAKLLLELVTRERIVPRIVATSAVSTQARFGVALSLPDDAQRVAALAKSFPLAAHAVPIASQAQTRKQQSQSQADAETVYVWRAEAALVAYLDMAADAVVRAAVGATTSRTRVSSKQAAKDSSVEDTAWSQRWVAALTRSAADEHGAEFVAQGFAERHVLEDLQVWAQPALGGTAGLPRICFRLELPDASVAQTNGKAAAFRLRYFMQAQDEANALVSAHDVYVEAASIAALNCEPRVVVEQLLKSLAMAGRLFAPIEKSLREARPDFVELPADGAAVFLNVAPALSAAGMGVILPAELTVAGQRRLRMKMRVGKRAASVSQTTDAADSALALNRLLMEFRWEAELDGEPLTAADLAELAALKSPLVRYRGRWVMVEREQLLHAQKLLAQGVGEMTRAAALTAALSGTSLGGAAAAVEATLPVTVVAEGELQHLLDSLREESPTANTNAEVVAPVELQGTLRPYQLRGLAWLAMMDRVRLGACLADDMGLGKSIQLLAFLLHRKQARKQARTPQPPNDGPILLVCPTSVLGNWQREIARFAPTLNMHAHYGPMRARDESVLSSLSPDTIVMTSYGLLRRDAALLGAVAWSVAVLDEAQNIKNAGSRTARTARSLNAEFRIALTGTPMENRLTELWSIAEFLNPGMLGSFAGFRREIAIPIERFAREDIAARLRQIVRPLILRRVKSDPTVIQDLPSKQEMTVYCSLTREQASLYQAALDAAMENIEASDGIERRGQVLALMTALKQICNHPAQYLGEAGPLGNRSGKLERLREMLEETLAAGDRVLVFTQYREMGDRLVRDMTRQFGNTVQYLHGGTPRVVRDAMVKRFQEDAYGPQIFVLSLKAGGTGLNLTAATHVFHYDRWWNPAVEDQATDRAYRIGQQRNVQVHKFLCAGTIEERVAQMLESKRDLAARIVGQGEQWITELDSLQLRELFSLAPNAVVDGDDAVEGGDTDFGDELPAIGKRKRSARATRSAQTVAEAS